MFSKLNQSKFLLSPSLQELDDAPDAPPTFRIASIVILSFIFIFIVIAIAFPVTKKLIEMQQTNTDTGMGNKQRIMYIFGENEILSTSEKLNDNHYKIPIQDAMDVIVKTQGHIPNTNSTKPL